MTQQPTKQDIAEFQEFVQEMIQAKQIKETDLVEKNIPQIFTAYQKMKKEGKWKSKKKAQLVPAMKKGGVLKFQIGTGNVPNNNSRFSFTPGTSNINTIKLTPAQIAGSNMAREYLSKHKGNLIKTRASLDSLQQVGGLPPGVKRIKIEPAHVKHAVKYHPDKNYQELRSLIRDGLNDDETYVYAGVEATYTNPTDSIDNEFRKDYPITIGKSKSTGNVANVTKGNQSNQSVVAMPEERNREADYNRMKDRSIQKTQLYWANMPSDYKAYYETNMPWIVPAQYRTRKQGGLIFKDGGSIKSTMKCGEVKASNRDGKKIMKKYCIDGKEKLVHAGAKGYTHEGKPSKSDSDSQKKRRANFHARHDCKNAKPGTPKHLACTELW